MSVSRRTVRATLLGDLATDPAAVVAAAAGVPGVDHTLSVALQDDTLLNTTKTQPTENADGTLTLSQFAATEVAQDQVQLSHATVANSGHLAHAHALTSHIAPSTDTSTTHDSDAALSAVKLPDAFTPSNAYAQDASGHILSGPAAVAEIVVPATGPSPGAAQAHIEAGGVAPSDGGSGPVDPELWIAANDGTSQNLITHADDDGTGTGTATNAGSLITPVSSNNPSVADGIDALDLFQLDTQDNAYFIGTQHGSNPAVIMKGSLSSVLASPTSTPTFTTLFSDNNSTAAITGLAVDPDNATVYFVDSKSFEKVGYAGGTVTNLDTAGVFLDGLALDLPHHIAYFASGTSVTTTTTTFVGGTHVHYHTNSQSQVYETSNLTNSSTTVTISKLADVPVADGSIFNGVGMPGITVDTTTGVIYFTTKTSGTNEGGIWSMTSAGVITKIYQQTGAATTLNNGIMNGIVVDHSTNEYFVSIINHNGSGGGIYVGHLNSTSAPTLWETLPTYNSGATTPSPEGFSLDNAPTFSSVTGTSAYALQGGNALSLLTADGTDADSDNDKGDGATITITNAQTGDQLLYGGATSGTLDGGKVTFNYNSTTHVMTLFGTDSFAEYQTLIDQVQFKDTGTDVTSGSHPTRSITFQTYDGLLSSPVTGGTTTTLLIDRAPNAAAFSPATVVQDATSTANAGAGLKSNGDLDGDSLTISVFANHSGTNGTLGTSLAGDYGHLTLNADGSYSYVADSDAAINAATTGSHPVDHFTFTLSDGVGGTTAGTLNFTIDRPATLAADNYNVVEANSKTGTSGTGGTGVLGNDSDKDGDSLTVTAVNGSGANVGSGTFQGTYGHLNLAANGSFTYTADNTSAIDSGATGSHLTDTFTYTVSDGFTTTTQTVTFTIDRAPTLGADSYSVVESGSASGTSGTGGTGVLGNDSDRDGDSLTVTAVNGSGANVGSGTFQGTYGHFNLAANGSFTYTANNTSAIDSAATGSHLTDTFTYTVSDGLTTTTQTVTFTLDRPPTVVADTGASQAVESGSAVTGNVLTNDSDRDSDSLTVSAVNGSGGNVGSSTAGTYGHVTIGSNGSYSYVADNTTAIDAAATGSHLTDSFAYTASDGHGGTTSTTLTFTLDRAPTVVADTGASQALESGSAVTGNVLTNDSDRDGDTLTVSAVNGSGGNVGSSLAGTYGHVTIGSNGSYSYVADNTTAIDAAATGSHLTDSFTYTASDGHGGTTSTTLTFTLDRAPTVVADNPATGAVESGSSVAGDLLTNDSDRDGDTLTVSAVNGSGGNVGSSIAGTYGHVTIGSNGAYSYVADNTAAIDAAATGSHLTDSFTYTASDGHGGTASTTITFTVDRAPTVVSDAPASQAVESGSAVTGNVLTNDSDRDGDTLTVSAVTGSGAFVGTSVAGTYGHVTIGSNGAYSYVADKTSAIDAAATGSHLTDTISYTASDGHSGATTTNLVVTLDRAPTVVADSANVVEGATVNSAASVLANDSDRDGDTVTLSSFHNASNVTGTLGTALAGTYGSLTLNSDGTYSYVASNTAAIDGAAAGSHPTDVFTYVTSDGHGGTSSTTLTFSVDRAPVANGDTDLVFAGGNANVAAGSGVLLNDTDSDSDTVTVTGISNTTSGPGTLGTSLAGVYGHLTLNADGSYSYAADNSAAIAGQPDNAVLTDVFAYTVADGLGGTSNATLTVTVDQAPTVTSFGAAATSGADLTASHSVTFTLDTGKNVTVAGGTTLTLSDGGHATYVSGSGTQAITFTETATTAPDSSLSVTGIGSGSIADAAGNPLAIAGTTVGSYTDAVSDTAANISAHIDDLQAALSHITSITDSDSGVLSITQSQFTNDASFTGDQLTGGALSKIAGAFSVTVAATGTAPNPDETSTPPTYHSFEDVFDASHNLTETIYNNDDGTQTAASFGAVTVDNHTSTTDDFYDLRGVTTVTATGGSGNDTFVFGANFNPASDVLNGGGGNNNQLGLDGSYGALTLGVNTVSNIQVIALLGSFDYNLTTVDNNVASGQQMVIWALNAHSLTFNGSAEHDGSFEVIGTSGSDTITGSTNGDIFYGLGGADTLVSNGGADTFVYTQAADSTGDTFDAVTGFDAAQDKFDFPVTVGGVDATVSGSLDSGSVDSELASLVGASQLLANHAVLFSATGGTLASHTFLIVDGNGTAGYQSGGHDYVIDVTGISGTLTTANFI